jgi:hypothetical protein
MLLVGDIILILSLLLNNPFQPLAQEWLAMKKQTRVGIFSAAGFQFFMDKN